MSSVGSVSGSVACCNIEHRKHHKEAMVLKTLTPLQKIFIFVASHKSHGEKDELRKDIDSKQKLGKI